MKNSSFRMILIWIAAGAVIGSLIGVLGVLGVIPQEAFESVVGITLRVSIGLIVLLLDLLCIWALLKPRLDAYILRHGESAAGIIRGVREIPRPDQLREDEWVRLVRYACTVTYQAGDREYTRELSPTPLTCRRDLYPVSFAPGNEIPLRYLPKAPGLPVIGIPKLIAAKAAEHRRDTGCFVVVPVMLTALYAAALFLMR